MARVLFLTTEEIRKASILSGNIDDDRFIVFIEEVQDTVIQSMLGTELYEKMYNYAKDEITPTGLYLELLDKFIKPVTKYQSVASYLRMSNVNSKAGGTYSNNSENKSILTSKELEIPVGHYTTLSNDVILRFDKWILLNSIPEYKYIQDEVNPTKVTTNQPVRWI